VSKHIVPAFGKDRIDAIDYPKLNAWVIKQSGKYAKDTVRLMVSTLRVILQEAVNEGVLLVNPVMKLGKFYRSAKKVKEKYRPFHDRIAAPDRREVPGAVSRVLSLHSMHGQDRRETGTFRIINLRVFLQEMQTYATSRCKQNASAPRVILGHSDVRFHNHPARVNCLMLEVKPSVH
jgi:hypothetical protein